MTDTTKPDLSREAVERLIKDTEIKSAMINLGERIAWGSETALMDQCTSTLRALLDAKEAAERDAKGLRVGRDDECRMRVAYFEEAATFRAKFVQSESQLTEARASAAAAWEAGRDAAQHLAHDAWNFRLAQNLPNAIAALTNPDPSATEALRRVKEAVWEEGFKAGHEFATYGPERPYRQPKDAAHG